MPKMFINSKNTVDHAVIDEHGKVKGGSFAPYWMISGDVTTDEKVVIDFSSCKKQIKTILDAPSKEGFDHKLWITPSSNCEWQEEKVTQLGVDRILVETPFVRMDIPRSRVKIVDSAETDYTIENAGKWFNEHVERELSSLPDNQGKDIRLECINSEEFTLIPTGSERTVIPFRYTHGLKNSSSWGCRNPAHGHLSFIDVQHPGAHSDCFLNLSQKIQEDLDGAIFADVSNISFSGVEGVALLAYSDIDNIQYSVLYKKDSHLITLDTETTIEFLVDYVANKYQEELLDLGATQLFVSEGLNKGAVRSLRD